MIARARTMGRLFWKFFFAFLLALLVAAGSVAALTEFQRQAREAQADVLAQGPRSGMRIAIAGAVAEHGGVPALRRYLQEQAHKRGPNLLAVDADGRELLGRPVPPGALAQARDVADNGNPDDAAQYVSTPDGAKLLVFAPLSEQARAMRRQAPPRPLPASLFVAIGIGSSLVFAALLAWYFSRPVRALRWALASAAKGDLDVRVAPKIGSRRDEIADLGGQFDGMVQQLKAMIDAQRRLFHDVSHELRSPLARLDVAVGLARRDPSRLEQSLERIERETARLDALVGQLLTLARLESGADAEPPQRTDLAALLRGVVDDAAFEGEQRSVRIDYKQAGGDGAIEAQVRPDALQSAFDNVLRNAIRFAPDGTTVDVTLERRGNDAIVTIADRGPGLPPDELETVFQPFVRGRRRSAQGEGFGLGLAIAARAVQAHRGRIRALARDGGGLVVEITLPLP